MAISPDQLAGYHNPALVKEPVKRSGLLRRKVKTEEKPKTDTPQWEASFYKNTFLNEISPNAALDRRDRVTGEQKDSKFTITEPMRKQYRDFLHGYAQSLVTIRNNPDTAAVLQGENHAHDRLILSQLVDGKGVPSEAKINAFLNNPAHWEITTLVLEHQIAREEAALAIKVLADPRADRRNTIDNQTIRLGIDQGLLRNLESNIIAPYLNELVNRTGDRPNGGLPITRFQQSLAALTGVAAGAGGGFFVGGPLGAVIGGSATAGAELFVRSMREGVRLNIEQSTDTFRSIMNDPNELAFMSEMTNINLRQYEIAGGQVQLRPGEQHQRTGNIEAQKEALLSKIYVQSSFCFFSL